MKPATLVVIFAGLLVALMMNTSIAISMEQQQPPMDFDVYLDDKKIGSHKVRFDQTEDVTTITTTANFVYTILYIPVYRYEHETVESWKGSCLLDIRSQTDDNGDEFFIQSVADENSMLIKTREGEERLEDCVRTYAYWDHELLQTEKLLNTQNGRYQQVKFNDLGIQSYSFEKISFKARRYELVTEEGTISLWYDSDNNWLALESLVESGSTVRYLSTRLSKKPRGDS